MTGEEHHVWIRELVGTMRSIREAGVRAYERCLPDTVSGRMVEWSGSGATIDGVGLTVERFCA